MFVGQLLDVLVSLAGGFINHLEHVLGGAAEGTRISQYVEEKA